MIVSAALLPVSVSLVVVDAIVTLRGLRRGFREVNPILAYLLRKFGPTGLIMTRIIAVTILLFLFLVLETWMWILFSAIFCTVIGYAILVGVKRTHGT